MALMEKNIGNFVSKGREVTHEGEKVRPEAKVSIISAKIKEIGGENNGTSKVTAMVPNLKFPFHGYIGINTTIFPILEKAHAEGIPVILRFEQKRKKGVNPLDPIEELTKSMDVARDNTVKVLVGVWSANTNEWLLTDEANTLPDEDPDFVPAGIRAVSNVIGSDEFFQAPPQANTAPRGGVSRNQDSGVNSIVNMYFFVKEQEEANDFSLDEKQRRNVALALWNACNNLQMAVYDMAAPDPDAYSHVRARFMVFKYCECVSPLNKEAIADFSNWGKTMMKTVREIWGWGFAQWDDFIQ